MKPIELWAVDVHWENYGSIPPGDRPHLRRYVAWPPEDATDSVSWVTYGTIDEAMR